jgi:hypothetical protein
LPSSLQGFTVSHRYEKQGYSLIGIQQSNLDGVPTMRYTFAKDNSVISVSEDKVGSQNAIVNEIFNPTSESITGVDTDNVALSGYSEVDRTESNYEGIKTIRVRFLKDNTVLSKSTDNESPLLTEVLEVFKPDSSRASKNDYVLVNKQESNVDGIPTERYTFKKTGVILSQSYELVGSQEAVVISKFGSAPTTNEANTFGGSNYTIAKKEESGTTDQKTFTYTFLQSNVELSKSEDFVGSQLAIVRTFFNPSSDPTESDYSLAKKDQSDFEGIKTVQYTFLKDDALLSSVEDFESSLDTITEEWFNPAYSGNPLTSTRRSKTDYELVRESKSNIEGIPTERYTFAKPCIISVVQDFIEDINTIQVTAFSKTEAEVKTALTEVTNSHRLINTRENNHDGIVTTTYTFEINTSDVVSYTANNRLQVVRTIYEAYNYDYNAYYDVGNTSITFSDAGNTILVLSELQVNKRGSVGTFVKLQAIFTEPGESSRSQTTGPTSMPGTEQITITSLGSTPVTLTETDDIKLISKQEQNNNGYTSFVRTYLKGTDATSTTNAYVSGRTYKVNSNGDYSSVGGPNPGIIGGYFQATSSSNLGSGVTAYLVNQIIGNKLSYESVIQVSVPGKVRCRVHQATGQIATQSTTSTQAFIESVPPTKVKIATTVTESVVTTVPSVGTLAYNLDGISCAVTKVNTSVSAGSGNSVSATSGSTSSTASGSQRSGSLSTSNVFFPGSYLVDSVTAFTPAGSFELNKLYRILTVGTTNYTLIGAPDNSIGTTFVATGVGEGTGTARWFGSKGSLLYTSFSTPRVTNNVIVYDTGSAESETRLIPLGATSQNDGSPPASFSTTGTIQQNSRPLLTTIDGTTYFQVVKHSKS